MTTSPNRPRAHDGPAAEPRQAGPALSRRGFVEGAAGATGMLLFGGAVPSAAAGARKRMPRGFGSATTAPRLPAGFTKTFRSEFVQANGIRQHIVTGGEGPPLLLVHGWPQNWYAWRFVMPALARDFTVIAVDQRGIGLTEKPAAGYDAGTLGNDMAALMTELRHERFAVVGHDTGMVISYALAADHRDRIERLAVAEVPGPPGVAEEPHYFVEEFVNNKLWHIAFNRVNDDLIVDMVGSTADAYYRYEFAIQGGEATALPAHAMEYYIDLYTRDRDILRTSFGFYRDWDATFKQNTKRILPKLTIPVLAIGGADSWGPFVARGMESAAENIETAVIAGAGHWVAEQAPENLLASLDAFLAPYRTAAAVLATTAGTT
jgi:pimeloyl-ACP methyl ester carboxylesterase